MKDNIKREDLKSNFLKNTVIRLDYDYLFEEDIELVVKNLNPFLIKKDYKMNSKTLNEIQIGFQMNKLDSNENPVDFNRKVKEEFSSYIHKDRNIVIDITRNYATMTVKYKENKNFEEIIDVFEEIKNQISQSREGIGLNRIGIRKTNIYFLKNINNINKYFEEKLFSFNSLIPNENVIIKKQIERFKYDNYNVNQNSEIQLGEYNNEENNNEENIYRIIFDIDIYDETIQNNKIDLGRMNDGIFKIYKSNLKEEFLDNLKEKNYENEELFKL